MDDQLGMCISFSYYHRLYLVYRVGMYGLQCCNISCLDIQCSILHYNMDYQEDNIRMLYRICHKFVGRDIIYIEDLQSPNIWDAHIKHKSPHSRTYQQSSYIRTWLGFYYIFDHYCMIYIYHFIHIDHWDSMSKSHHLVYIYGFD